MTVSPLRSRKDSASPREMRRCSENWRTESRTSPSILRVVRICHDDAKRGRRCERDELLELIVHHAAPYQFFHRSGIVAWDENQLRLAFRQGVQRNQLAHNRRAVFGQHVGDEPRSFPDENTFRIIHATSPRKSTSVPSSRSTKTIWLPREWPGD